MNLSDVENTGTQFIVTVKDTKNYYPRNFIIGPELYDKVNDYIKLRPTNLNTDRFFLQYRNGVCVRQVIGKNKISEVPKTIATFLKLNDPETYTGHCLRRTAATLLANSGANLTTVKQLGGWKSGSVAEGYIEHSLANRRKIFQGIINSDNSLVKENVQNTTLAVSAVSAATATQVTNACNRSSTMTVLTKNLPALTANIPTNDADDYPPFDIDQIDESELLFEPNVIPDDQSPSEEDAHAIDKSLPQKGLSNISARKRVIFQDMQNINNNLEFSKKKNQKGWKRVLIHQKMMTVR